MQQPAILVLEDGTILYGVSFGAVTHAVFELVFNTSMTGYQEVITDPSYRGQGVVFTNTHIGNVGINTEDYESAVPQVSAIAVRRVSHTYSNWRADRALPEWLAEYHIPAICEVDTRLLTRKLRDHGTMKAGVAADGTTAAEMLEKVRGWQGLDNLDMVEAVTCSTPFAWQGDAADKWLEKQSDGEGKHLLVYDFGAKRNIIRHLAAWGARVTILPAYTPAQEALALHPDGIVLSNGPGDPAGLPRAVKIVADLIRNDIPIFGICLGHQLIGLAIGAETGRLKFGHHGSNHPVQDTRSQKVLITSQNHNYTIVPESLDVENVEVTYQSLNDGSIEGIRLKNAPVSSVQFHPEASPGPQDADYIFNDFFSTVLAHYRLPQ